MRRLLAVLLLLSFVCQAYATARLTVALDHGESASQVSHAEMHWEGVPHHHDEDGVAHQDDSTESMEHLLADAGPGTVALLSIPAVALQAVRPPAPVSSAGPVSPSPHLDGLRRPPRLNS